MDAAREVVAAGTWDYVYVEPDCAETWSGGGGGGARGRRAVRVVNDEWVVQSLIWGRLIDDD